MAIYRVTAGAVMLHLTAGGEQMVLKGRSFNAEGVEADHLKHLKRLGLVSEVKAAEAPKPAPAQTSAKEPKSVDKMTVEELKAYASEHSIDLGEATKKDEILAAVQAAGDQSK